MSRTAWLVLVLVPAGFLAAPPAPADEVADLATALKPLILASLPEPLYEWSRDWGRTSMTFSRIKWTGGKPHVIKVPKNDGTWRKLKVSTRNPKETFEFKLSDWRTLDGDRQAFRAFFALMVVAEYEQQLWENGVRIYSTSARARLRVKAHLDCENTIRLESKPKSFIPDTVFRLRVVKADVGYDNYVMEHIAGIGGTGARWLGEALQETIKEVRPSLERDLFAKANAAILKAGDTREVRLSLSGLMGKLTK